MKLKQPAVFSIAVLLLTLSATFSVRADNVDRIVLERMKEQNIPGAAVAVIKNGKTVKVKGYGIASLEFGVPVSTDTVFEIGSVSKQMTAAAIMILVEDGKVRLDEKISAYLPGTPEAWKDVTVRHLLTHTSGIKSYTSLTGFELSRRVTIDGFIKQLSPYPLEFTPGEKNIYSNSGYNLLAYIIQTQSGKPYMEFMRERIFLPLGMTRTGDRDPQFIIPQRAGGYEWRTDRYVGRDGSLTDLMGAGSITSTIADMIKWEAALRGDSLLKPESKREMWTQYVFNSGERSVYGFGWRISEVRGHKLIGHTGQTAGFGAAILRYIDDDVTVIALTNLGELGMGNLIASRVAKLFIPTLSLKFFKKISDHDKNKFELISRALRARIANESDLSIFTPEFVRTFTTERSKRTTQLVSSSGAIRAIDVVGFETVGNTRVYRLLSSSEKHVFLWRVTLDSDGKISDLVLEEYE